MKITLDLGPSVGESSCGKCPFAYVHKEEDLHKFRIGRFVENW